MIKRLFPLVLMTFLAVLAGCAAREELVAKSAAVPAGVDLSGQWQLRADDQDTVRRIDAAELKAAGGEQGTILVPRKRPSRAERKSASGAQVHVFLETGKSLKLTQTEFGLFVSFDRAIVEEYRFGEKRTVNVGPVMADRVSGWEGQHYVIVTRDKDGAVLTETYRLDAEGDGMIRTITISHDGENQLDVNQVFERL